MCSHHFSYLLSAADCFSLQSRLFQLPVLLPTAICAHIQHEPPRSQKARASSTNMYSCCTREVWTNEAAHAASNRSTSTLQTRSLCFSRLWQKLDWSSSGEAQTSPWQPPCSYLTASLFRGCRTAAAGVRFGPPSVQPWHSSTRRDLFQARADIVWIPRRRSADKIGRVAHRSVDEWRQPIRGTLNHSERPVRNNNRPREGIQRERGLMSLVQPATPDKAPAPSTASRSLQCEGLLSA